MSNGSNTCGQVPLQPFFQRTRAIREPLFPFRIPVPDEHVFVDTVHQGLLDWEVPVEQWLRDTEVLGQVPCARLKPVPGEEADGRLNDFVLPILGGQTPPLS